MGRARGRAWRGGACAGLGFVRPAGSGCGGGAGRQGDRGRQAEHFAERAEQAVGLGGGGEEGGKIWGVVEEVAELAGGGVDVVMLDATDEPGVAGGEGLGGTAGAGGEGTWAGARLGEGTGLPAGDEAFEAGDGAGEAVPDAADEVTEDVVAPGEQAQGDLEAAEDGPERGG